LSLRYQVTVPDTGVCPCESTDLCRIKKFSRQKEVRSKDNIGCFKIVINKCHFRKYITIYTWCILYLIDESGFVHPKPCSPYFISMFTLILI